MPNSMLLVLFFLLCQAVFVVVAKNRLMPWLCLEICDSAEQIAEEMSVITAKKDVLSAVSFEIYTLGDDCAFVQNMTLTNPHDSIVGLGLESWPMITSYPHPPAFIEWMRKVMFDQKCGDKFIQSAIDAALQYQYSGYNLDWEPVSDVTNSTQPIHEADARGFADFIDKFSKKLEAIDVHLTVDIATWSTGNGAPSIWNYTLIADTSVHRAITMGTYTGTDATFMDQMALMTDTFDTDQIGIGLMWPLNETQIAYRLNQIQGNGIKEVDIWRMPIPDDWWPALEEYVNSE
jgi:hypothetical protein